VPQPEAVGAFGYPLAGGIRRAEARPGEVPKQLEAENGRLRKAVAELALERVILKEAVSGNF
jgi:hypothetical protein